MSLTLLLGGEEHGVTILRRMPHLVLGIGGREVIVQDAGQGGDGSFRLKIGGREVAVARAVSDQSIMLRTAGRTHVVTVVAQDGAGESGDAASETRAPMPGSVIELHVGPGAAVTRGQVLVTIESMKLQTALVAARDGVVAEVAVSEGEAISKDQLLVRLDEGE